jgi:hypothetical protein
MRTIEMKHLTIAVCAALALTISACDGDSSPPQPQPTVPGNQHPDNGPGGVDECPRSDGQPCM